MPGHLLALAKLGRAGAHAREELVEGQAGDAQGFGEGLRIGAVVALGHGCPCPWCCVEADQRAGFRLDNLKPGGEGLALLAEGAVIGEVEHDDARFGRQAAECAQQVGHAHRIERDIRVALDSRAHGHQIVFTIDLQTVAAEIDGCDRIRAGSGNLVEELPVGGPQSVLIEVAGAGHVEIGGAQGLGHEAGIVGRRGQRRTLIAIIADHEGKPCLRALGARWQACRRESRKQGEAGSKEA